MGSGSNVRASSLLRLCGDWNCWGRQNIVEVLVACDWRESRPSGVSQVLRGELGSEHLLDEEGIALALDLIIDSRYGVLQLGDLLLEFFRRHLHRLTLELLHDGLIDECEKLLNQRLILRLRRLCKHENVVLRLADVN